MNSNQSEKSLKSLKRIRAGRVKRLSTNKKPRYTVLKYVSTKMPRDSKFVFVRGTPSFLLKTRLKSFILSPPKPSNSKPSNQKTSITQSQTFTQVVVQAEEALERLRAEKRAIFIKIAERNKRKRELTAQKVLRDGNDDILTTDMNPSQFNDHLDQNRVDIDNSSQVVNTVDNTVEEIDYRQRKENKFMKKPTLQFMQKRW
jgi:hypothetical protein